MLLAQFTTADRATIEQYSSAIKTAESGASPGGIEAAFSAARPVQEALVRKLEDLTDEQFKRLKQELQGLIVNREEIVFIKVDVEYFTKLAAARGKETDRAFFSALKATYPNSIWPVYVEQQTDYSGCTRFGSMSLVETYRVWSEFQRRFPNSYVTAAKREADAVLDELLESTCACGATAGTEQELEQFLRSFPVSPVRARIDERLKAIRDRRSDIRPGCVSG